MHRFVWDLHYPPPPALHPDYPIAAIVHDTPREPRGPWVLPGRYRVRLTADGRSYAAALLIRMDPRIPAARSALARQFALARRLAAALRSDSSTLDQVRAARKALADARSHAGEGRAPALDSLDRRAAELERGPDTAPPPGTRAPASLERLNTQLTTLYNVVEGADVAPTDQAEATARELERALAHLTGRWRALEGRFPSQSRGLQ